MLKKIISCIAALSFALVASAASAGTWTAPVHSSTQPAATPEVGHQIAAAAGITNYNNPRPTSGYCPNVGFIYIYYVIETTPVQGQPGGIIRPGRTYIKYYTQTCV